MVEQPATVEAGVGKMTLNLSSSATSPLTLEIRPSDYRRYPPPLATYDQVVASPTLFRETLEKLHAAMGSKFKIPTVGGKDLDLHHLFVEVTSRGGITKILQERRWKEIIGAFTFPSSATNASFILRKYYFSLLHHYEQIYFVKAQGWSPTSNNALQMPFVRGGHARTSPTPKAEAQERTSPTPKAEGQEGSTNILAEVTPGSEVLGVIDGKFESGYLITVKVGSQELKGVLYQLPSDPSPQVTEPRVEQQSIQQQEQSPSNPSQSIQLNQATSVDRTESSGGRKRRKKSETKKRDPDHPKPNRSGYNFFFAEEHARLKRVHPDRDRHISRMIGDSWNKLNSNDKAIYQEKALKDKERYATEMERYKERLRTGQMVSPALPSPTMDVDHKPETGGASSSRSLEIMTSSNRSDESNLQLSVGQTTYYREAMNLMPLGPDLNLMAFDMPIKTEDASESSANDERNLVDHPIVGEILLSSGHRYTQGNEGRSQVQKKARMDGK